MSFCSKPRPSIGVPDPPAFKRRVIQPDLAHVRMVGSIVLSQDDEAAVLQFHFCLFEKRGAKLVFVRAGLRIEAERT